MRCCTCRLDLPADSFSPGNLKAASSRCRDCVKIKNRQAYNPAQRKDAQAKYWEKNRERLLIKNRERYQANRERYQETHRRWWDANRERINAGRREFKSQNTYRSWVARLKRHGLTPELYWELLDTQSGGCAICGATDPGRAGGSQERVFAVDHCHSTGRVRGLLCHLCNRGLGMFRDRPDLLLQAIAYLE